MHRRPPAEIRTIRASWLLAIVASVCACPSATRTADRTSRPRVAPPADEPTRDRADETVRVFLELRCDVAASAPRRERVAAHRQAQDRFLARRPATVQRVLYRYDHSPCLFVELSSAVAQAEIAHHPLVRAVHEDRSDRPGMFIARRVIGAEDTFEMGIIGAGTVAAVIDSGIDAEHPDLADAVIHQYHFLGQGDDIGPGATDELGHGTHVSGILAGRGEIAIGTGVAPGAELVVLRVIGASGRVYRSDWVAAVEYAIRLHEDESEDGIRIDTINMSLESLAVYTSICDEDNPALGAAAAAARAAGIALAGCSGNHGNYHGLSVPGCLESTVSVGATERHSIEALSDSSNRAEFLDLVAPGRDIVSDVPGGGWGRKSGCSMAVPLVSGTVCLMREVDPAISPTEIDELLQRTGVPVYDPETDLTLLGLNTLDAVLAARSRDCNDNGERDWFDIHEHGISVDCNGNEVPDDCDIATGASADENGNGIPDECSEDNPFHRGDASTDGRIDIVDVFVLLTHLFSGGVELHCTDAADASNDGSVDISDALFVLNYLYVGGPAPPAPGPPGVPCGFDTEDFGAPGNLGCHGYRACGD